MAPEQMADALDAVLSSGEVDAVVTVVVATGVTDGVEVVRRLEEVRSRYPEIPVVLVPLGGLDVGHPAGLTTYGSPVSAVRALGHAVGYATWRAVPAAAAAGAGPRPGPGREAVVPFGAPARSRGGSLAGGVRGTTPARSLRTSAARDASRPAPTAQSRRQRGSASPWRSRLPTPAAAHKSERRLVRTGLTSTSAVRLAVAAFEVELEGQSQRSWCSPWSPAWRWPSGSSATRPWDRSSWWPPEAWRRTCGTTACSCCRPSRWPTRSAPSGVCASWPLLQGTGAARAADVADLERLVVDLGRLAVDVPEIAELDLNPVMVGAVHAARIVDVRLRLSSTDDPGAGTPRQLRRIE